MNEEYMEYLEELEESLHKGIKLLQKAKQKMGGQMGFREGGYGNRFGGGMMPNGYPHMGGMPPMGMPPMGQMGFREGEMMERSRDAMGRYTRG